MSMTGITVDDELKTAFQAGFQAGFKSANAGPKLRYMILGLSSDFKRVSIVKTVTKEQDTTYDDFVNEFPPKEPRWALYDFEYELEGAGKRSKICLYSWVPTEAPVTKRMVAATSNDAITKAVPGIQARVQATDYDQLVYEEVFKKVSKGA